MASHSLGIPSLFENEFEYPGSQAKRSAFHAPHHTVQDTPPIGRWVVGPLLSIPGMRLWTSGMGDTSG